jgi:4'-phosphopantetheinyl transferase
MPVASPPWPSLPVQLQLGEGGIHLWRGEFRPDPNRPRDFTPELDEAEGLTAGRFLRRSDQERYAFAHHMLRSILGRYTGCRPRRLRFSLTPYGKPWLADPAAAAGIHFSLSHSRDVVLVALSRSCEIGVDVEYIRPLAELEALVGSVCSARERAGLAGLPAAHRPLAFFKLWTLKEAFTKAIGLGLSYPLPDVEILARPEEMAAGRPVRILAKTHPGWRGLLLNVGPDYCGALAAPKLAEAPRLWRYRDDPR